MTKSHKGMSDLLAIALYVHLTRISMNSSHMHMASTKVDQVTFCLHGGAGTGKSHV